MCVVCFQLCKPFSETDQNLHHTMWKVSWWIFTCDCRFKMLFMSRLHYWHCSGRCWLWFVRCCEQLLVAVVISWHSMITWWRSAMIPYKIKQDGYNTLGSIYYFAEKKKKQGFVWAPYWLPFVSILVQHFLVLPHHRGAAGLGLLWSSVT